MIAGHKSLGNTRRCNGKDPVWFVITPVNPEAKVPITEQTRCSELIAVICTQLEEFGAMTNKTDRSKRSH